MFVWPSGWMPPIAPRRSAIPPSGWVLTTQWALSSKATTPELVAGGHRRRRPQDRLLADVDLADAGDARAAARVAVVERVAVAGVHRARLVDHDDEGDVGLLLLVLHAHVDRQRLLDGRVGVAAGAVALRPADHHQPAAEVADVLLDARQLGVAQAQPRHVDEDDRVPGEEAVDARGKLLGDERIHRLVLDPEGRHELGPDLLVAGQDQDPRLAVDDRVRIGPVVLAERVASRLDDGPERVEAGLGRLDEERHPVRAGDEIDRLRGDLPAVGVEPDRRRLGDGRGDLDDRLQLLADLARRRRRQPVDHDLVRRPQPDRPGLDLDPAGGGQRRLALPGARGVVAVRDEDDPFLGVVGEERRREPQRRPDVGRGANRRGRDPVDLADLGRQPLHERGPAEPDDARDVALGHRLQAVAEPGEGVLAARRADRIGQVDDEDGRQPVDRQDEPDAGEGQDEAAQDDAADEQGEAAPAQPDPPSRGEVQGDRQPEGRDQQEQGERDVEVDAHQPALGALRRTRPARPRHIRWTASRW